MKKTITILILLIIAGASGYYFGSLNHQPEKNLELEITPEASLPLIPTDLECPYHIYNPDIQQTVRRVGEASIKLAPKPVVAGEVVTLDEPFNQTEFEKELYPNANSQDWSSRKFDVNEDDEDETIISASVAMTQSPHIAMIVKDKRIIFRAGGSGIWITDVGGNNGFELYQYNTSQLSGDRLITRYIASDGGFKPIWTQRECWIEWE